jgi:hypothetical protein
MAKAKKGNRIAKASATTSAPDTVKIEKIDLLGKGRSFRFFVLSPSGEVLTAKMNKNHADYKVGMEVPVSELTLLDTANEKQLARYNSNRASKVLNYSLLLT